MRIRIQYAETESSVVAAREINTDMEAITQNLN